MKKPFENLARKWNVGKAVADLKKGGQALASRTAEWSREAAKHVGKAAAAGFMATWKGLESVGDDIAWVAQQVAKGVNKLVSWLISLFACLGTFSDGWTTGYSAGMKDDCGVEAMYNPLCCAPDNQVSCCQPSQAKKASCAGRMPTYMGFSMALSAQFTGYIQWLIGAIKQKPNGQLKVGIGVVFGFCPGTADSGGIRLGIGIGIVLACGMAKGEVGCPLTIAIGFTGSALVPTPGGVGCPGPPALYPFGFKFGCSVAYAVAVTVMCCKFELISGEESCR
jgi:hypothetical protein